MRARWAAAFLLTALWAGAAGEQARGACGAHPWCDSTSSPDRRAALLLDAMTLDERLGLLSGRQTPNFNARLPAIPRLGVPSVLIADGPAGVSRPEDGSGVSQPAKGEALALPSGVSLAASFDADAARSYGAVVADEARDRGVDVILGPALDLVRTPRAGRGFETLSGEDPFLGARLGASWIRGAQARGVIATAKHFVAYNQETARFGPRAVNAIVAERALRELYLPAFEAAVRAKVGTVMSSYNRINGLFADQSRPLLRDVLKREWGFRGPVVSDFTLGTHGTSSSLLGGLDVELPAPSFFAPERLKAALAAGEVTLGDVDVAVRRVLRTLFRFGVFDRAAFVNRGPGSTPAARRRAVRALAERGIVLLKNSRGLLPLPDRGSIAVVGSAAARYEFGGGSSQVDPPRSATPVEGLRRRAAGRLSVAASDDPAAAAAAARDADVAVVFLADDSSEFEDKTGITLADGDPFCTGTGFGACGAPPAPDPTGLVRAVAAANPNTVVVLETGGPVLLPWASRVPAILEAWYPGQQGGDAIARVLLGEVSPAGRLPQTFPRREADLPVRTQRQFPGIDRGAGYPQAVYAEDVFVGYRHFDRRDLRPRYPFGHGLSYTSFSYRDLRLERVGLAGLRASIAVTNTGRLTGDEVVQLYVGIPGSRAFPQPPRQLKGFERVALRPGASRRVSFALERSELTVWDPNMRRWTLNPGCYRVEVGASSRDIRGRARVGLAGGAC